MDSKKGMTIEMDDFFNGAKKPAVPRAKSGLFSSLLGGGSSKKKEVLKPAESPIQTAKKAPPQQQAAFDAAAPQASLSAKSPLSAANQRAQKAPAHPSDGYENPIQFAAQARSPVDINKVKAEAEKVDKHINTAQALQGGKPSPIATSFPSPPKPEASPSPPKPEASPSPPPVSPSSSSGAKSPAHADIAKSMADEARKQVMSLKKGGAALDVAAELPASAAASATPPVPSPPKPAETSKAPEQEPSLSTMPVPNHLSAQSLGGIVAARVKSARSPAAAAAEGESEPSIAAAAGSSATPKVSPPMPPRPPQKEPSALASPVAATPPKPASPSSSPLTLPAAAPSPTSSAGRTSAAASPDAADAPPSPGLPIPNANSSQSLASMVASRVKSTASPAKLENINVELRVSVAPWLAQDEALAKSQLEIGALGPDLHARVKVAPWLAQGEAPEPPSPQQQLDADTDEDEGGGTSKPPPQQRSKAKATGLKSSSDSAPSVGEKAAAQDSPPLAKREIAMDDFFASSKQGSGSYRDAPAGKKAGGSDSYQNVRTSGQQPGEEEDELDFMEDEGGIANPLLKTPRAADEAMGASTTIGERKKSGWSAAWSGGGAKASRDSRTDSVDSGAGSKSPAAKTHALPATAAASGKGGKAQPPKTAQVSMTDFDIFGGGKPVAKGGKKDEEDDVFANDPELKDVPDFQW